MTALGHYLSQWGQDLRHHRTSLGHTHSIPLLIYSRRYNKSFVMMAKLRIETGMLHQQFLLVEINEHSVISDGLVNQGHNKHALVSQNPLHGNKIPLKQVLNCHFWGILRRYILSTHITSLLTHDNESEMNFSKYDPVTIQLSFASSHRAQTLAYIQ